MPGWVYILLSGVLAAGLNLLAFGPMKTRLAASAGTGIAGFALGAALLYSGLPPGLAALAGLAAGIAAGGAILDLCDGLVADIQSFAIAATGIGASLLLTLPGQPVVEAILLSAGGGALAAGILWGINALHQWRRGQPGLGEGDVILAGAAGCWAGLPLIGPGLLVACLVAVLLAVATGRVRSRIPFAPGLVIGFGAAAAFRLSIWQDFQV